MPTCHTVNHHNHSAVIWPTCSNANTRARAHTHTPVRSQSEYDSTAHSHSHRHARARTVQPLIYMIRKHADVPPSSRPCSRCLINCAADASASAVSWCAFCFVGEIIHRVSSRPESKPKLWVPHCPSISSHLFFCIGDAREKGRGGQNTGLKCNLMCRREASRLNYFGL